MSGTIVTWFKEVTNEVRNNGLPPIMSLEGQVFHGEQVFWSKFILLFCMFCEHFQPRKCLHSSINSPSYTKAMLSTKIKHVSNLQSGDFHKIMKIEYFWKHASQFPIFFILCTFFLLRLFWREIASPGKKSRKNFQNNH